MSDTIAVLLLVYIMGLFFALPIAFVSRKSKEWTSGQALLAALCWPLHFFRQLGLMGHRHWEWKQNRHVSRGKPQERWERGHRRDYNEMVFTAAAENGDSMEDFIFRLSREQDSILQDDLTITYQPTGASKTYKAGTPYPSELLKDWKSGYFMTAEKTL